MRFLKKAAILFLIFSLFCHPCATAASTEVGTTFSQVQCEYLGLDWKEIYAKTLSMGFKIIRLGAYWERIERQEGKFDFSELDYQIRKAAEQGIRVILTVGMKAPRWPEYFIPTWVLKNVKLRISRDISQNRLLRERTLEFIRQVITRYSGEDCIIAWQVENEPLNRAGSKDLWIGEDFLREEVALVRRLDGRARPTVVNAMTYSNRLLRFLSRLAYKRDPVQVAIDIADIPGLNVYFTIGQKIFSTNVCFLSSHREHVNYLRQFIARAASRNKKIWVTELQAEPWEAGQLVHLNKEPALTCGADTFKEIFNELSAQKVDKVLLWGVEYWYSRQKLYKDSSWLESVREIIK